MRKVEKRKKRVKIHYPFVAVAKNIALVVFKIGLSYLSLFNGLFPL